jgi:hypothetical protein
MKAFLKATVLVLGLLIFMIYLWVDQEGHSDVVENYGGGDCNEYSWDDSLSSNYMHDRCWMEYVHNEGFASAYNMSYRYVSDAEASRNNMYIESWIDESDYWKQVYGQLYIDNKDYLQSIQDSLLKIKSERNLDRDAFATMVVAFVQDIPYEYVINEECNGSETAPCNGGVLFGIYSPVEFLGRMHGDCDTRTVLLYTLLRNLGYEPLIINSNEYLHSMLALDIATTGDDFEYKGKRYAYWETTNVGWLAGMLPPDMNNKDYWSVALDYEF